MATVVYYHCLGCAAERAGDPGKMFCDECGGEVRSIGYVITPGDATTAKAVRALLPGDDMAALRSAGLFPVERP